MVIGTCGYMVICTGYMVVWLNAIDLVAKLINPSSSSIEKNDKIREITH